MKTIKIIDLLNKIANGEEVPKQFNHCGINYVSDNPLTNTHKNSGKSFFMEYYLTNDFLNDEVEILDEEDEFEDIEEWKISDYYKCDDYQLIRDNFEIVNKQINQLIKNQKKIIERIKNND